MRPQHLLVFQHLAEVLNLPLRHVETCDYHEVSLCVERLIELVLWMKKRDMIKMPSKPRR